VAKNKKVVFLDNLDENVKLETQVRNSMYKRKIRCSFCYEAGHNRVGCEKRKAKVAALRLKQEACTQTGLDAYLSYNDRCLLEEEERRKAQAVKQKACSYCSKRKHETNHDHNRRNCPILAEDKADMIESNKTVRAKTVETLKQSGVAVGAVFNHGTWGKCLITDISWNNIHPVNAGELRLYSSDYETGVFSFMPFSDIVSGRGRQRAFSCNDGHIRYICDNIVVPVTERAVEAQVPEGWESGKTGIDFFFSTKFDKCV